MTNNRQVAQEFIAALQRQAERKALFRDGIEQKQDPRNLIISLAEEVGEVATDYARQRTYGTVAECVDVAHSALLLVVMLDPDGSIISRIGYPQ